MSRSFPNFITPPVIPDWLPGFRNAGRFPYLAPPVDSPLLEVPNLERVSGGTNGINGALPYGKISVGDPVGNPETVFWLKENFRNFDTATLYHWRCTLLNSSNLKLQSFSLDDYGVWRGGTNTSASRWYGNALSFGQPYSLFQMLEVRLASTGTIQMRFFYTGLGNQ